MVLQKAVPELKHQEVLKRKISHFINSFSHNKILQHIFQKGMSLEKVLFTGSVDEWPIQKLDKQLLPDYSFPYVDMASAVQKIITTAKASLLTSHG